MSLWCGVQCGDLLRKKCSRGSFCKDKISSVVFGQSCGPRRPAIREVLVEDMDAEGQVKES